MGKSYWVTNLRYIKSFAKILSELGNVFDEPAGVAVNERLLCRRGVVEGELRKDLSCLTCSALSWTQPTAACPAPEQEGVCVLIQSFMEQ